jgi:hypothetical protein
VHAQLANQLLTIHQPGGDAFGGGDSNCPAHVSPQVRACDTSILTWNQFTAAARLAAT